MLVKRFDPRATAGAAEIRRNTEGIIVFASIKYTEELTE